MSELLHFPELNPSAITIPAFFGVGPLHLRWYALGFLGGLAFGGWWMGRLAERAALWRPEQPRPNAAQADDFVFWALLAVILGGRIGYIVFYMLPDPGLRGHIGADPLILIKTWEGGLSFHGGFLAVVIAALWFAHKHKIAALTFGDLIAAASPVGIFLVRIANFVNGELYGRHSDAPWAMRFPEGGYDDVAGRWLWLGAETPRHPSQLYEAALEGAVMFAILNVATFRFKSLQRPGLNIGLFLIWYGLVRVLLELVRQPDAQMPAALQGSLTMGMVLSAPMALAGAWLAWRAARSPARFA